MPLKSINHTSYDDNRYATSASSVLLCTANWKTSIILLFAVPLVAIFFPFRFFFLFFFFSLSLFLIYSKFLQGCLIQWNRKLLIELSHKRRLCWKSVMPFCIKCCFSFTRHFYGFYDKTQNIALYKWNKRGWPSLTVIIVGNRLDKQSLNLGRCCLCFSLRINKSLPTP